MTAPSNPAWAADAQTAAKLFGIEWPPHSVSLCPYGPVYKFRAFDQNWILKRTGYPRSSATAICRWLMQLREQKISAVYPALLFGENPIRLTQEDKFSWVIYPFISGDIYTGAAEQISAAGDLLGRIHQCGRTVGEELLKPDRIDLPSAEKINSWHQAVSKISDTANKAQTDNMIRSAAMHAMDTSLLYAACSWDYKASNLVFASGQAFLIDPDHAGNIPRLYDLACAVILFHCDQKFGPHRLWAQDEWKLFLQAYKKHVALTDVEQTAWLSALSTAWLVEGLWLLAHFPEGWADPQQAVYLKDLLAFNPRNYPLT